MPSRADASRIGRGASSAALSWSSADSRRALGLLDRGRGLRDAGGEAVALRDRRLVAHGRAVDLLGVRGEGGVVLAQRRQRRLRALARRLERLRRASASASRSESATTTISSRRSAAASRSAASSRRDRPCPDPARSVCSVYDLTGAGHDRDRSAEFGIREGGTGGARGIEVVGDHDVRQDAEHARPARRRPHAPGRCPRARGTPGLQCTRRPRSRCRPRRDRRRGRCGPTAKASSRVSTSTPSASGPSAAAIAAS